MSSAQRRSPRGPGLAARWTPGRAKLRPRLITPAANALGQAAQLIEGEVKQYIADGIKPGLGQRAIDERTRRLGSNKAANGGKITPLVLSGQLRASITGKVTKGGGTE